MKILIVRLFPDEININNYNVQEIGLAKALVKKGHTCDIVLYTNKEKSYMQNIIVGDKNIKIYWLKGKKILGNAFFDKELMEIIKNYDIIQSGGYDQIYNIALIKKINKPLVIYHGNYYSQYSKGYKKKCYISDFIYTFYKKYKKVQFISKSELSTDFLHEKGFENVKTIGVGLDTDRFENTTILNKDIEKIKENKKNFKYLLYIGKIEERRNILFLLRLIKEINNDNSQFKLILVGKGSKDYMDKCKNFINENNIKNNVIYIESLKQEVEQQLYNISDMFLLPTQHEIFGMVILESMYFGLPVITTYNGGSSVLINNNKNGFIESLNIERWRDIIINNIDNANVRKNAKATIDNEFTWDKLSDKFVEVYNQTIKNYNGRE